VCFVLLNRFLFVRRQNWNFSFAFLLIQKSSSIDFDGEMNFVWCYWSRFVDLNQSHSIHLIPEFLLLNKIIYVDKKTKQNLKKKFSFFLCFLLAFAHKFVEIPLIVDGEEKKEWFNCLGFFLCLKKLSNFVFQLFHKFFSFGK